VEDLADVEEPAPAKRPRKAKPYVPSLRTGPYALILALSSIPEDSLQSLTKSQVIELAQPHCESSFTTPSEVGKFYTAWNSMTTLVRKDFVQEKGRPLRKYALTEEGWEVAKRIRAVQGDEPAAKSGQTSKRPEKAGSDTRGCGISVDLDDNTGVPGIRAKPTSAKESSKPDDQPKRSTSGQPLGDAPNDLFGILSSKSRTPEPTSTYNFVDLSSSPEPPGIPRASSFTHNTRPLTSTQSPKSSSNKHENLPLKDTFATVPKDPSPTTYTEANRNASSLPTFAPITLHPGTFTVHLVIDNREVRSKDDRDYISSELSRKSIRPLTRPLDLGDFIWIAKTHDPALLQRYGEDGDEIVLDYIVERKRLDDLVGSIIDGRFVEQKFRLRKSGVKNVIYLIEDYSLSQEKATRFHEAINSAIASTQVVNGFFVKRTAKLDDSIRYLARMTHLLKQTYEKKPLHLIPTAVLTPTNHLPLLDHLRSHPDYQSRNYYITFPSFASLSSKSDTLTLRDVFLKMLMCTRGISGDKALAIQKMWGTPRAFIEAFEACENQKERERLVETRLGGLVGRAKVKGVLGAKVAGIWGEA